MIPPLVMRLRVTPGSGRGFGLWLPLFVVWPLLLVLLVLLLPLLILADLIMALCRYPFSAIRAVWSLWAVLCSLHGLHVDVDGARGDKVLVSFN